MYDKRKDAYTLYILLSNISTHVFRAQYSRDGFSVSPKQISDTRGAFFVYVVSFDEKLMCTNVVLLSIEINLFFFFFDCCTHCFNTNYWLFQFWIGFSRFSLNQLNERHLAICQVYLFIHNRILNSDHDIQNSKVIYYYRLVIML